MEYNLISKVSSKLSKKQIKKICELKDKQWKFGIKSQINWYKKNIKNNDIHNLFFINSKLIGYTLLRKRTCYMKNMKSVKYLLFDTLIVDKRFRGKKLSNLIMDFNNNIIKQSGFFSFLICKKELISFYKKFGWIKIKNKNIVVRDHSFSTYGMTYNQKYFNNKKEKFWELTYFLDRKKKTMSLGHFISEVRGTDTITKEMINLVKEHKNKRKTRWLTDPKTSRFLNFYVKP